MAESLFSKFRTLTVGNMHAFLNAAMAECAPDVLDQRVRDLEEAKGVMERNASDAIGRVASTKAVVKNLQLQIERDTQHIDWLLGDDDTANDKLAEPIANRVTRANKDLLRAKESVVTAQATAESLDTLVRTICARHVELVNRARELRRLDAETKANEQAADTLQQASVMMSDLGTGTASIDDQEQKLLERNASSKARLDRATSGMGASGTGDGVDKAIANIEAQQFIASRKAAIAAKNTAP